MWWDWPPQRRKSVKQQRWLTADDFARVQHGEMPRLDPPSVAIHHRVRLRNAVSRATDSAGAGGELFEVPYSHLGDSDESDAHLTVFARTRDDGATTLLLEALDLLGRTGYGADASVGHGAFDVDPSPQPCPEFDNVPGAGGFVALSTFQPAAHDPVHGWWRAFVKYGKLAPELHAHAVCKRPQVMLEPGACFRTGDAPKAFYGAAIGPDRLLDQQASTALAAIGVHPVQAAFTLAVPIKWQNSPLS